MVVSAHPLASEVGITVLKEGGNAVDAAIATLFMLNVVEPYASGLGGGGFALVRMSTGEEKVVIYRERAPGKVDASVYYDPSDSLRKLRSGGTAVCVPGAPAGWAEIYDRWGTKPLEYLASFAINTAENGFLVDPTFARQIKDAYPLLSSDSLLAKVFLKDGLAFEVGDTFRQPLLANTMRWLVTNGLGSFYRGPIAESVVEAARNSGSSMTLYDLEFYRCEVVEPLRGRYRDFEILTAPPPSAGGAALLETLMLFERVNNSGLTPYENTHLLAQCIQQGLVDAEAFIEDSEINRFNPDIFFSEERINSAFKTISLKSKPCARPPIGLSTDLNMRKDGNTTHLVVYDRWGNAVSLTQSINYFFGAGVMAGSTGILLNNQMADFSVPPDSVNTVAPRKMPRSNMTPLIVIKDNQPVLIIGTPGGGRIVSTTSQLITNMIDLKMDISTAIDAPRFYPTRQHLVIENRQTKKNLNYLKRYGYEIHLAPPFHHYFGGAHGIWVDYNSKKLIGAADRRRGGAARGY